MDETLPRKIAFRRFVHRAGTLVGQLLLGADGLDLEVNSLQVIVPLPMLLHEGVSSAAACRAGGKDQNVALRLTFFRCSSFVKCLDHECIVNESRRILL